MKGVGEPGAGEPHARFDGGELEKESLRQPTMAALGKPRDLSPASPTAATSPAPYPTNLLLQQPAQLIAPIGTGRWYGQLRLLGWCALFPDG